MEDRPFSWTEKRSIDARLAALGHQLGRNQRQTATPASRSPAPPHVHAAPPPSRPDATSSAFSSSSKPTVQSAASGSNGSQARPPSFASTTTKIAHQKKRRPRRVIELDSLEAVPTAAAKGTKDARAVGGSMPLPSRSTRPTDETATDREGSANGRPVEGTGTEHGDGNLAVPEPAVQSVKVGRKGGRRTRVSASMFEAPTDPSS